jgi:hypothetical protein
MPRHSVSDRTVPSWIEESERIVSVREAARLRGIHEDTFRRHYPHLIQKLSTQRHGVRLGDVLALNEPLDAAS